MTAEYPESKQERREKRRAAKESKMAKHGKGIALMYRDAILKRLRLGKSGKKFIIDGQLHQLANFHTNLYTAGNVIESDYLKRRS
jgi:hypothetical protein